MDNEFLQAIQGAIGVWDETGREGTPNVCVPIDKMEGFIKHLADLELKLAATKTVADAALFQMQANAERMDTAELRLDALRQED